MSGPQIAGKNKSNLMQINLRKLLKISNLVTQFNKQKTDDYS